MIEVTKFKKSHLDKIRFRETEKNDLLGIDHDYYVNSLKDSIYAKSIIEDFEVICSLGANLENSSLHVWIVGSEKMKTIKKKLIKEIIKLHKKAVNDGFRKFHGYVNVTDFRAIRFAEFFGYVRKNIYTFKQGNYEVLRYRYEFLMPDKALRSH